ncbi:MAG: Rho termination factor N-terminal domain-containing protein [Syntrophothermus sp.]
MTRAELETKHLSELHALAAEAGVAKYRMLTKGELIDALGGESAEAAKPVEKAGGRPVEKPARQRAEKAGEERAEKAGEEPGERPPRRRRRRRREGGGTGDELGDEAYGGDAEAVHRGEEETHPVAPELPAPKPAPEPARPRRRRRRRFGRRSKEGVTLQDLLLPAEAGRQAILFAETREACTALLRGVAADLAGASKGPDPVVLLIDPGPEELADWKREAPQAEIVSAGQPRHASDALAQAAARASAGEDVILVVDSLTRLATDFADTETAKQFFDAGRAQGGAGGGSLTVVAAVERS